MVPFLVAYGVVGGCCGDVTRFDNSSAVMIENCSNSGRVDCSGSTGAGGAWYVGSKGGAKEWFEISNVRGNRWNFWYDWCWFHQKVCK